MSAPVGVLSVMDDVLSTPTGMLADEFEALHEARAAVADLIEASRHCEARLTYLAQDGVRVRYELKAIRDALALVTGEAA